MRSRRPPQSYHYPEYPDDPYDYGVPPPPQRDRYRFPHAPDGAPPHAYPPAEPEAYGHPYYPPPPVAPRPPRWRNLSLYLWGTVVAAVAGFALFWDPGEVFSRGSKVPNRDCQEVVQPQSVLSREDLAQLLSIPERDSRERVRAIVTEPYCILPSLTIRAGTIAVREAYPLEFDPDTWLVILYEGEEYAGYRFIYR